MLNGDNLIGGGPDGVCVSTDDGKSWTLRNDGLTNLDVVSLAGDGWGLFAGTQDGVFYSSDNGENWIAIGMSGFQINCLAVSPTVVLAGTDAGLYRLATGPWSRVANGFVHAIVSKGSSFLAGTYDYGVLLSEDDGVNWQQVNTGFPLFLGSVNAPVGALVVSGDSIIAGTSGKGAFTSTNNGANWNPCNTGLSDTSITCLAAQGSVVFAGTFSNGMFLSTDGGTVWVSVNTGITGNSVAALAANKGNVFAGTDGGVFVSSDTGAAWASVGKDVPGFGPVVSIDEGQLGLFVTDGSKIFVSADGGTSWSSTGLGIPYGIITSVETANGRIFAATNMFGIFVSADAGKSWEAPTAGLPEESGAFPAIDALLATRTSIVLGSSGNGAFRSTDNGESWLNADSGMISHESRWIYSLACDGATTYAGTLDGVYVSSDDGASWSPTEVKEVINSLAADNGLAVAASADDSVFFSTDGGKHWTRFQGGASQGAIPAVALAGPHVFAGFSGYGSGICQWNNLDMNWRSVGLSGVAVSDLKTSGDYLLAGTATGIWCGPLSVIASVHKARSPAEPQFHLYQNYPNPFNPTTVISYNVPYRSKVVLKLFDVLGRQVKILVNESANAGEHSVRFDGNDLPSGVYFYRLEAGAYHDTRKLLLLK